MVYTGQDYEIIMVDKLRSIIFGPGEMLLTDFSALQSWFYEGNVSLDFFKNISSCFTQLKLFL